MFEHMTNDRVSLVKKSGKEYEDIKALVESKTILIEDETLPIEEGDTILRKLPNGLIEKYLVLDRGFIGGIGGSSALAHYEVKVRKESSSEKSVTGNIFNLHGPNSRINIHSKDSSINTANTVESSVFNDLRQVIQNGIANELDKEVLLAKLDELQQASGKKGFVEKYREFMELASDHITLIAPFVPALSQLLS
jgi:hypothetical protein